MEYLPISIKISGATAVLVGGGHVATRKARSLLAAGAKLSVVAPEITDELLQALEASGGSYRRGKYRSGDLKGASMVVAATPNRELNRQVFEDASSRGIPVNVVDDPAHCSFIFPAVVDRSPLTIAISSGAHSPVLTRLVRRKIEALIPAAYGRLAEFSGRLRDLVRSSIADDGARRRFWEHALEGSIGEQVLSAREAQAEQSLRKRLAGDVEVGGGEVYLVGAGPGDPDLMTFKALRLLQDADVVLYDRLVSPAIVDLARRDAERIYVGKSRADHTLPQGQINQMLVDLARQGKRVVRLKGGDPFIFGRGGEEIELLARNHIPFQVVPGITAASGAACYAGIPLTHRDYAQSVRFLTGHLRDGSVDLDWEQLQSPTQTLVFYMGLEGLPVICKKLQAYGRSADTPIALIEQGTLRDQRVLVGTLATMPQIVEREQPHAPTLLIVGDVVRLHSELAWFGER